jgi:lipoprotein-anchoring transpeptidase ErfK/SrfK
MISRASTVAIAVFALLGGRTASGQSADTTRRVVDTTKKVADTARKMMDSVGVRVGSPPKAAAATKTAQVARRNVSGGDVTIPSVDGPVRLAASLSEKTLTVMAGDNAVKTFRVAVGTSTKPTPKGSFKIRKIVWNPSWNPPDQPWAKGKTAKGPGEPGNPMKVAKIFFQEPDYYIHGTGEMNSLGTADSHGCIRMSPDEVAALAKFLMEHGGNAQEEGWFSRVVHLRWQTHTVILDKPISLTISN